MTIPSPTEREQATTMINIHAALTHPAVLPPEGEPDDLHPRAGQLKEEQDFMRYGEEVPEEGCWYCGSVALKKKTCKQHEWRERG